MKKLEDIPKKSVFKVPDGYFEDLPMIIQSRMTEKPRKSVMEVVLRYSIRVAMPVAALVVAGIFWFRPAPTLVSELDEIDAEQIAFYLNEDTYTDDDSHEPDELTPLELDQLEDAVYSELESLSPDSDILNELDIENL